jgi:flagellar hook-length control protein FliK
MNSVLQILPPAPATEPRPSANDATRPRGNETEPNRFADSLNQAANPDRNMNERAATASDDTDTSPADATPRDESAEKSEAQAKPKADPVNQSTETAEQSDLDQAGQSEAAETVSEIAELGFNDDLTGLFEVTLQLDVQPITQGQIETADPELIQAIAAFINRQSGNERPTLALQAVDAGPQATSLSPGLSTPLLATPVNPGTEAITLTPTQQAATQAGDAANGLAADVLNSEGDAAAKPSANASTLQSLHVQSSSNPVSPSVLSDVPLDPSARPTNSPVPSSGPSATAFGPPTADEVNTARIQRGLNTAVQQQGGGITLRLTPPELGTVRIQLQVQGTSVNAQFHAESEAGRNLLQQQLGQLRNSLEAQGLSVERIGVQAMSSSTSSNSLQQDSQQQQQPQSQSGQNDGRSRGQYQSQQQQQAEQQPDSYEADSPATFDDMIQPQAA